MSALKPPRVGRLLVRARRLGHRRREVEADLLELLQIRARVIGPRRARRRYLQDAASLWLHGRRPAPPRSHASKGLHMQSFLQDLRYAFRMMRKAPGFTAIAVLSLAVGIGANTTLFSITDAVLLRTLPVPEPDRLVLFNWQAPKVFRVPGLRGTFVDSGYAPRKWGSSTFHHRMLAAFQTQQQDPASPFEHLFAFAAISGVTVLASGEADTADGQVVTGEYFEGLGVPALAGRVILPSDVDAAAPPVAVLSHSYWQERFAGDPGVIGRQIAVNNVIVDVIGVTPASFRTPSQVGREPDVTLPISLATQLEPRSAMADTPDRVAPYWPLVMGRLKPGATLEHARGFFGATFQTIALDLMPPPRRPGEPATLEPKDYPELLALDGSRGLWEMRSVYSEQILILFGVVGLVLVIACANVANLLLSRAAQRAPEITLRLAMGAGRWRVVRQLLTESVVLAGLGGLTGVVLSIWGTRALTAFSEAGGFLPADVDYSLNWRVLAFSAAASLATGILFGIAPAWRAARRDLTLALKDSNRAGAAASRAWITRGLVIAQVALSLVLLVGAGLFVRTLGNLRGVDMGFNEQQLLTFGVRPAAGGYEGERLRQFYADVAARLDAIPGAVTSTFAQMPLVARHMYGGSLLLPGETESTAERHGSNFLMVRENFLQAMEIPVVRGRGFRPTDNASGQRVAVISEQLAREYFAGEDPIGQRVGYDDETRDSIEIVGIARDIVYNSQREDPEPLVYLPWAQEDPNSEMYFSVRAAGDPLALAGAVREAVRAVDPNLPVLDIATQETRARETLAEERQYATLIGIAGAIALMLAAIGLYGVIAYWVNQRTSEIGLRMALGAQASGVLRLVVRQAMTLVLLGLAAGAAAAYWLSRVIERYLYGVQPNDPATIGIVGALLVAMALAACAVPARRAARLDPMIAFRS